MGDFAPLPHPMLLVKLRLWSDKCYKRNSFVATQNTASQKLKEYLQYFPPTEHKMLPFIRIFVYTVIRDSHPAHCNVLVLITSIVVDEFWKLRSIFLLLLQETQSSRLQLITKPSYVPKRQHIVTRE